MSLPIAAAILLCTDEGGGGRVIEIGGLILNCVDVAFTTILFIGGLYETALGILPTVFATLICVVFPKSFFVVVVASLTVVAQPLCDELCLLSPWCKTNVIGTLGVDLAGWALSFVAALVAGGHLYLAWIFEADPAKRVGTRLLAALLGGGIAVAAGYSQESYFDANQPEAGGLIIKQNWLSRPMLLVCFFAGQMLTQPVSHFAKRAMSISASAMVYRVVVGMILALGVSAIAMHDSWLGQPFVHAQSTVEHNHQVLGGAVALLVVRVLNVAAVATWFSLFSDFLRCCRMLKYTPKGQECAAIVELCSHLGMLIYVTALVLPIAGQIFLDFGRVVAADIQETVANPPSSSRIVELCSYAVLAYCTHRICNLLWLKRQGLLSMLLESAMDYGTFLVTTRAFEQDVGPLQSIGSTMPNNSLATLIAMAVVASVGVAVLKRQSMVISVSVVTVISAVMLGKHLM